MAHKKFNCLPPYSGMSFTLKGTCWSSHRKLSSEPGNSGFVHRDWDRHSEELLWHKIGVEVKASLSASTPALYPSAQEPHKTSTLAAGRLNLLSVQVLLRWELSTGLRGLRKWNNYGKNICAVSFKVSF